MNRAKLKREMIPYVYIVPATFFMFLFVMVPILLSVVMSFYQMPSLSAKWTFVGLKNFASAFRNVTFLNAMGRTLIFGAFSIISNLVLGLLLSILVAHHKLLNFYRYIFYLPAAPDQTDTDYRPERDRSVSQPVYVAIDQSQRSKQTI